jgi:hypothetical protein
VFPVLDEQGAICGLVTEDAVQSLASDREVHGWALAADVMQRGVSVRIEDDVAHAGR